jgi:hypothetical protein
MSIQPLAFETWKIRLREDCERNDKLHAYNCLSEECLRILWELDIEPSVPGIVDGGNSNSLPIERMSGS